MNENNEYIYKIDMSKARNISSLVADKLSEAIRIGKIKPGERLIQTNLAEKFNVSRVAIRDALQNLVSRGLATSIPKKGIIVRELSIDTVEKIYNVRCVVESYASKEACKFISNNDLFLIKKANEDYSEAINLKKKNIVEFDWRFHKLIYSKCGNEVLIDIIDVLWSRLWQIRSFLQLAPTNGYSYEYLLASSIEIHNNIINAIEKKDTDNVEKLVREMIGNVKEEILNRFKNIEMILKKENEMDVS